MDEHISTSCDIRLSSFHLSKYWDMEKYGTIRRYFDWEFGYKKGPEYETYFKESVICYLTTVSRVYGSGEFGEG